MQQEIFCSLEEVEDQVKLLPVIGASEQLLKGVGEFSSAVLIDDRRPFCGNGLRALEDAGEGALNRARVPPVDELGEDAEEPPRDEREEGGGVHEAEEARREPQRLDADDVVRSTRGRSPR